ncbi:cysteine-rich PDZ-binding protein isoform X2 [Onychomys torridus]|uniref:cysteine-rich PDZ-binding protein isoform X2 n=1 Tax=Onychomys torridus TaxID=38674 RepID=UPI00167FAF4C|nr:cysteine-rich PDZ-binding protein isoform X2 [Onychomys torridus]
MLCVQNGLSSAPLCLFLPPFFLDLFSYNFLTGSQRLEMDLQNLPGEKKLGTVITPDTWKDGARNTTESGGRKLNENKALTSKKARFDPYGKNKFSTCRICKSSVHQPGSHYCQGCAYKKGICAMCGKKVLDTKNYKQTSV